MAGAFDRSHSRRGDPGWLSSALARAKFLLMKGDSLVLPEGGQSSLLWGERPAVLDPAGARFLGERDGEPLFGLNIGEELWDELSREQRWQLASWRQLVGELEIPDAELAAYAISLERWHERARFCGRCGAETRIDEGGHSRGCTREGCPERIFPRTDPVVIAVVTNGERCLLGRHNRARSSAMFTALAGFVEPGESAEQAVAREIHEEAGVRVRSTRYFDSQPWPFPHSLMLGFHATTEDEEIRIDPTELLEARWFTREELRSGEVLIPPPYAIANRLIHAWVESEPESLR